MVQKSGDLSVFEGLIIVRWNDFNFFLFGLTFFM